MKPDGRPTTRLCLQSYFNAQKRALVEEFSREMPTCVMAMSRRSLAFCAKCNNWDVCKLRGVKVGSAVVVQKPGGIPELWVRRSYTRYRNAFVLFLREYYNASLERLPREWDVDHMQSTHRFKQNHPPHYIRLALVPRSTNASYGAGFEKMFYTLERERPPPESQMVDWIAFLKVFGAALPGRPVGREAWQLWSWDIALAMEREGITHRADAYVGISTVLNLGYTGTYRSLPLHSSFRGIAISSGLLARFAEWFDESESG